MPDYRMLGKIAEGFNNSLANIRAINEAKAKLDMEKQRFQMDKENHDTAMKISKLQLDSAYRNNEIGQMEYDFAKKNMGLVNQQKKAQMDLGLMQTQEAISNLQDPARAAVQKVSAYGAALQALQNSGLYKDAKIKTDEKGGITIEQNTLGLGKDYADMAQSLRKEYSDQSKNFITVKQSFGNINALAKDPTGASDMSLIFSYMKMLDPNSTVREGEYASAKNAGNVDEKIRASYNSAIKGTLLAGSQRKKFVEAAQKLYQEAERQHQPIVQQYSRLASNQGINPEDVVTDYGIGDIKEVSSTGKVDIAGKDTVNLKDGTPFYVNEARNAIMKEGKTIQEADAIIQNYLDSQGA